jgi:hypothetical protein
MNAPQPISLDPLCHLMREEDVVEDVIDEGLHEKS